MPVIINEMDVAVEPVPSGESGETSPVLSPALLAILRREIEQALRRQLEQGQRRQHERDARLRAD